MCGKGAELLYRFYCQREHSANNEEREIGAALWFSYFLKTIIVGGPHM
jgi:hypothetical protein